MANKFLNGIAVTGDGSVTGKLSADNFELTSGTHHLTFTESADDWSILNAGQSNGIVIWNGTSGIDFLYDSAVKTTIDTNGLKVFGTSRATGLIVTPENIIAGEGGGGVALTVNDGYGNANVTFNHVSGTPEQNGNSFRIETNTDSSTGAVMTFEISEGVSSGVAIQTAEVFRLEPSGPKVRVVGGGILHLERDDTGIVDGNPLGRIKFGGDDPVNGTFNHGAEIKGEAAGTWSTDNYPTELQFYTTLDDTSLIALKLDKNQNTHLTGNLNLAGGNIFNSTGDLTIQNNAGAQFDIKSNQGVRLYIDANGDDTVHKFEILSNTDTYDAGNVVASVDQSGNATFAGQVTIPETPTADAHAASKKYVDDQITDGVDVAKRLEVTVKNKSGGELTKGTVVHASPSANPPSGNVIEVVAADANDSTAMPALGILNETIADEAEGKAVMFGSVTGIDTSSFNVGDELYVSTTVGTLTETKPTAIDEQVQKIGVVIKSHASSGHIKVFGAGRSNDVPNFVERDITFGAAVNISSDLSAAQTIDYPLVISSKDDHNNINQLGGEGVGIQFKIAGNDETVPGNSFLGASIAAIRKSAVDSDSNTDLAFFTSQNDETLDEAFRVNSDGDFGIGTGSTITGKFNSYITADRQITHNGNGGDLSVISDNGTTPVFYVKGTGSADLVNVFDNTTEVFTIKDGGYVGLNENNPTSRLHIHHTEDDTDQDLPGSFAMEIDGNFTGTNTITTGNDREQGALYIDVDSSSTGGDTSDEHRVYGIYSDTTFSGTADQAVSIYGRAEQNTTTANSSSYVIGVEGVAVTDGGADFSVSSIAGVWGEVSMQDSTPVTNSYGGYFKNMVSASRIGATTTSYGLYSEVEINSSSDFTNIKGARVAIDVNTDDFTASTIQGLEIIYTGTSLIPSATNIWSIYSGSDIKSYHKGSFGIGRAFPEVALHVGPTALVADYDPTETVITVSDTTNGAGFVIRGASPYTWFDVSGGGTGQIFLDSTSFDIYSGTPIDRTGGAGDTKGTSRLHVASDGKIGINDTNPTYQLSVYNANTNVISEFVSGDNQAWISVQDDDSGTYGALFGTDTDAGHNIVLASNSAVKRLVVDTSGNVGIGALDVDSLLHIESTSDAASPIFTIESDNAKKIELGVVRSAGGTAPNTSFLAFDGDFRFITGSGTTNEAIRIDSDGNLGVGEDNPDAKIHVLQTVDTKGIRISSSTVQPELTLIDDATGDYFGIGHNRSASLLHFEHNNTSLMYLSHDGNLGIGTNDIDGKLHVVGDYGNWKINGYGGMYFNNSSDTNNTRYIHPRSNGDLSIGRGLTANLTSTDPDKYFTTDTDQLTLEAGGGIIFNDYGSGSNTGTVAYNLAVDSSGNIIENSANTRSIFVATSTDTTTDVNATTTVNWNSEDIKDSGYTHSETTDPDEITITQAGTYKIYSAITYNTTVQRANVVLEILVNGTATTARGAGGYVRSDSGHNTGTTIVEDYVTISANDVIKIQTIQEAAGGTANLISSQSKLIIEKLTGLTLSTTNANTLGGLGATDFVAVAGDTMTGALSINEGGATIKKTNSTSFQPVLTIEELADEGSTETLTIKNSNDRDIGIKLETGGGFHHIWQDSNSDDPLIISAAGNNRANDSTIIFHQDHSVEIPNNTLNLGGQSAGTRHIKMDSGSASTANSYIGNYLGGTYLSTNYYYASGHNSDVATQRSMEMFMDVNDVHFATMPAGNPGTRTRILTIDGAEARVGIGTDNPITKLNVVGNVSVSATKAYRMYNAANNAWGEMSFIEADNRIQFNRGIQNSGVDWRLSENSADSYVCANEADFGIGTTTPNSKLQVAGGIQMADDTDAASASKVGTMRYRTGTEYVEVNGKNLVYKGDFSKDEGWTKGTGWSIDGGVAKSDGTQTADSYLNQTSNLVQPVYNKIYKCMFTVSNRTAGLVGPNVAGYHNSLVDSNGAHTVYVNVTNVNSNTVMYLQANASFVGHVDNFQVYEVEEKSASYADMCMQTGSGTYEWVNIVQNIY
jgi:hypothetical protein